VAGVQRSGSVTANQLIALPHVARRSRVSFVLGIDAAWTERGSSGVALLEHTGSNQRIIAVAPSYAGFCDLASGKDIDWTSSRDAIDVPRLLSSFQTLAGGARVDVVAIDMPMSRTGVTARREADRQVSRAFGKFGAAVHSPTIDRPGVLGLRIVKSFGEAGFPLRTKSPGPLGAPSLIEVFPLASLVQLMAVAKRPMYKVGKMARYLVATPDADRIDLLLEIWQSIFSALGTQISDLKMSVPTRSSVRYASMLKPYEDALDAIISAWAGACFADGTAEGYGDDDAAIWIPLPRSDLAVLNTGRSAKR
jgi:predicted RNase H-like nuclease